MILLKKVERDYEFNKLEFDSIIKSKFNTNITDYPYFNEYNVCTGYSDRFFNKKYITIYYNDIEFILIMDNWNCFIVGVGSESSVEYEINRRINNYMLDIGFSFKVLPRELNDEDKINIKSLVYYFIKKYFNENNVDILLFGKNTKLTKYYRDFYEDIINKENFYTKIVRKNMHYKNDLLLYIKNDLRISKNK